MPRFELLFKLPIIAGTRRNWFRVAPSALIVVLLAIGVSGCTGSSGPTRSVALYCQTFWDQGKQFRAEYQSGPNQNTLLQMIKLISAPQELATLFAKLDKVAPDDIEPDVAEVQASFQKEADNLAEHASNPLAGLLSGLVNSVSSSGSWQRVNDWTDQHCGQPPG